MRWKELNSNFRMRILRTFPESPRVDTGMFQCQPKALSAEGWLSIGPQGLREERCWKF